MEKQVYSNTEGVHQTKFNKITVFLTKFVFGENLELLKKLGYVDGYIKDPLIIELEGLKDYKYLFLLFKNKKMSANQVAKIIKDLTMVKSDILFSYEIIDDYFMILLDFPNEYREDYLNIINGSYSKLSEKFKNKFPSTVDVKNEQGKRIGKEYTLYHQIFNKTEWLKNFWRERLNLVELDDSLELWQKPDERDLTFNIKQIIK